MSEAQIYIKILFLFFLNGKNKGGGVSFQLGGGAIIGGCTNITARGVQSYIGTKKVHIS